MRLKIKFLNIYDLDWSYGYLLMGNSYLEITACDCITVEELIVEVGQADSGVMK